MLTQLTTMVRGFSAPPDSVSSKLREVAEFKSPGLWHLHPEYNKEAEMLKQAVAQRAAAAAAPAEQPPLGIRSRGTSSEKTSSEKDTLDQSEGTAGLSKGSKGSLEASKSSKGTGNTTRSLPSPMQVDVRDAAVPQRLFGSGTVGRDGVGHAEAQRPSSRADVGAARPNSARSASPALLGQSPPPRLHNSGSSDLPSGAFLLLPASLQAGDHATVGGYLTRDGGTGRISEEALQGKDVRLLGGGGKKAKQERGGRCCGREFQETSLQCSSSGVREALS